MVAKLKVLIIGGVAAGPKTASRLRRLMPEAEITIVERGNILSYAGCGMPYCIAGDMPDCSQLDYSPLGIPRNAAYFQDMRDIRVMTGTVAQAVDRREKTVTLIDVDTGEAKRLPYDKLVIATGGVHFTPPIPGIKLNRVFHLARPEDAVNIRNLVVSGLVKSVVIIGGGLIGMETAEAFLRRGLKVTIVEMLPHILPRMLDPEMSIHLMNYLCSKGVDVRTNERVERIVDDGHGNVTQVVTDKGEIAADLVLVSVGVRPNSQLAKDAGLEIGVTGGIVVNEFLQTSDPDIYAAGDCVENRHLLTGQKVFWPMGSTANKHGRVIANHIAGLKDRFEGIVGTAVVKVLEYNVGKTGLTETEARQAGFDVLIALNPGNDRPHYYPTHKRVFMKLVADAKTGRVLGLQTLGPGDGIKRIDVMATALQFGATLDDVAGLDLGYAPPYSGAIDLLAHSANIIRNKLTGVAKSISPAEVMEKLKKGEDFVWLDVRTKAEFDENHIDDPRVRLIPLQNLRERMQELPRDKEIIVFCAISLRGYEAQCTLEAGGFDNVKFMDGGIIAWPYEKACFVPPDAK